jgi:hypothetical protein
MALLRFLILIVIKNVEKKLNPPSRGGGTWIMMCLSTNQGGKLIVGVQAGGFRNTL